ncbi:MAG: hypothetical protein HOO67_00865 [Candidatus Peribacteraceae bacterium]|nr:hypothetical protein [Candidatus Peribacteraceae bacterium]
MPTQPYRVLLMNLGYATGLDGSLRSYLFQWYRYLYTPRKIIRRVRQSIYGLLNRENPDLCCFVEIHRKHGFVPHPHAYTSHIDNKYGRFSILRRLPFFRDNCNGFFSRNPLEFRKRYFSIGSKKLVYDIELGNGLSLLLVHFALSRETRKRQCIELKEMLQGRSNTIVCGDFNIFKGTRELSALAEACGLQIVNAHHATFPAVHPRMTLDLFLCPKNLSHVSAKVMDDIQVSDHLPVMLELRS